GDGHVLRLFQHEPLRRQGEITWAQPRGQLPRDFGSQLAVDAHPKGAFEVGIHPGKRRGHSNLPPRTRPSADIVTERRLLNPQTRTHSPATAPARTAAMRLRPPRPR